MSIALTPDIRHRIQRWVDLDPDPATRAELRRLAGDAPGEAADLFGGRIGFGTAGLRAAMGPGPLRMNRLVVRQTTAGLLQYLRSHAASDSGSPGANEPAAGLHVVIGYDARHNSEAFAQDTAAVVAGAGARAELIEGPVPTPVLALAVLDRGADAGVMITASHNPAIDNGYKLYLADGIQLVGPADAEIASAIDQVAEAMADPSIAVDEAAALIALAPDGVITVGSEVAQRHLDAAVAACVTSHREVSVLYTAMHGVGGAHLLQAFEGAGFPPPRVVPEQFDPDPDFPTAPYPNPEEPGALDLALAAAAAAESETTDGAGAGPVDVVLANDPDADRLAVAVRDPAGAWTRLSGDQIGVLLADHLIRHSDGPDRLVASSIVSSRMISAMAEASGVTDVRTLTGFKWVARPIVEQPENDYLLGYEEALGYCVGTRVRDKDGISAALVMAELVAEAMARGETLFDRLDRLAVAHGVYSTAPVTLLFDGADGSLQREQVMERARTNPPAAVAGVAVDSVEDLALGATLPPTDGLIWLLADRTRIVVRPSGTEPKLKAYIEVIEPVDDPADVESAKQRATDRITDLAAAVDGWLRS